VFLFLPLISTRGGHFASLFGPPSLLTHFALLPPRFVVLPELSVAWHFHSLWVPLGCDAFIVPPRIGSAPAWLLTGWRHIYFAFAAGGTPLECGWAVEHPVVGSPFIRTVLQPYRSLCPADYRWLGCLASCRAIEPWLIHLDTLTI
jgi:hypothetical protein